MSADAQDQRFVTLEIKLAEQEDTLHVLNQVITAQADQLDRLEQRCRQLKERLDRIGEGAAEKTSLADEVPPHY